MYMPSVLGTHATSEVHIASFVTEDAKQWTDTDMTYASLRSLFCLLVEQQA